MESTGIKVVIKIKRKSRRADETGFNGYGKLRSNCNLPYGLCHDYQKKSGIYYLKNKVTNLYYIGSSNNIGSRISKHFSQLIKGNHPNYRLKEDFDKYGIDSFDFGIFEFTNENLLEKEKEYQLQYGLDRLYNLQIRHNHRSDKQKAAMINQDKRSHKTEEYRSKMRALKSNRVGKFDMYNGELIEIYENSNEAATKNNVAISTLLGCCNGSKRQAKGYIYRYIDANGNIIAEGKGRNRTIIQQNEDIV